MHQIKATLNGDCNMMENILHRFPQFDLIVLYKVYPFKTINQINISGSVNLKLKINKATQMKIGLCT